MVQLISEIEKLGFTIDKKGCYVSTSAKTGEDVVISFVNHDLECYQAETKLFSVLYGDLSFETLLVLLTEFGIIQRFIKN